MRNGKINNYKENERIKRWWLFGYLTMLFQLHGTRANRDETHFHSDRRVLLIISHCLTTTPVIQSSVYKANF
jgi:hypothetical protein